MSTFVVVAEDVTNRNQSWEFTGLYRNNGGEYRVHVRANAYEDQSYATLESWGLGGWLHVMSLPTEAWWGDRPSYTKKTLGPDDLHMFLDVRDELMIRYAHLKWDSTDPVELSRDALLERNVVVQT